MSDLKKQAAFAALSFIDDDMIVGVGTGSTVNYFIDALATMKSRLDACVASSKATEALLRSKGIMVLDLNVASTVSVYVDGADEVNHLGEMIKGGGGALTREKILANATQKFICIVDESKVVRRLGGFPVAVEVIPMARSMVARALVALGGSPIYRDGFITDNGNIILDVYNLTINEPMAMEQEIKAIVGVVDSGIFAHNRAHHVLVASQNGVSPLTLI